MITKFKIYENENNFKIGDMVYILKTSKSIKSKNGKLNLAHDEPVKIIDIKDNRYITDLYPSVSIHKGNLIHDYEYNAKKYNI